MMKSIQIISYHCYFSQSFTKKFLSWSLKAYLGLQGQALPAGTFTIYCHVMACHLLSFAFPSITAIFFLESPRDDEQAYQLYFYLNSSKKLLKIAMAYHPDALVFS